MPQSRVRPELPGLSVGLQIYMMLFS